MKRFFVDIRIGCLAVRDRQHTDPDYQGLHNDTPGVVRYWHGVQNDIGDRLNVWTVDDEDIAAANALCDELNAETIKRHNPT